MDLRLNKSRKSMYFQRERAAAGIKQDLRYWFVWRCWRQLSWPSIWGGFWPKRWQGENLHWRQQAASSKRWIMSRMLAVFVVLKWGFCFSHSQSCFPLVPLDATLKNIRMNIARHSFVPLIKDATAASQGVNSKWGLALPSTVRTHYDLDVSCFLPPSSLCHPPPPCSVSLYPLKTSPSCWACWQGVLTRMLPGGKARCPGPRGGMAARDGTSASALNRKPLERLLK